VEQDHEECPAVDGIVDGTENNSDLAPAEAALPDLDEITGFH
jgi:hypothetical protein